MGKEIEGCALQNSVHFAVLEEVRTELSLSNEHQHVPYMLEALPLSRPLCPQGKSEAGTVTTRLEQMRSF